MKKKVAIVTTHPIQYYAPLFKLLAQKIELKVFYTWGEASIEKFDPGFGKKVEWDIPLLDGYDFQFLENNAKNPGSHGYSGIKNPAIVKILADYNPSAIIVIGWCYESHLKVLRYFKGKVPVYFRGDSTLLDNVTIGLKNKIKRFLRKTLLKWVYSHVDKIFYVGTASKEYYLWAGLKNNQLVFAPHSIDNRRFNIDKSIEAMEIRKSLLIDESAIVILFAGKLEPKKNPKLLLECFKKANNENLHLLFIGNGVQEDELKDLASKGLKKNKIHFVDFQNQSMMSTWYQVADLYCLPSKGPGETWGLAINEAMVCGKPIIASDKVGCTADLVSKEQNGWIFESNNEAQLQEIINNIPSKERLKQMGEVSRKIIKEWSIESTVSSFIQELN